MPIEISFTKVRGIQTVYDSFGRVWCDTCGRWSIMGYTKPLLCNRCQATQSEYSPYVSKTVNSRMLYYNNKRGVYP
jgi:hypothetical protein